MTLRYGSVCSGIEAATVAWRPLGMRWIGERMLAVEALRPEGTRELERGDG